MFPANEPKPYSRPGTVVPSWTAFSSPKHDLVLDTTVQPLLLLLSHPVMSDSLHPHGHTRPPCPSPSGVCLSSSLLHQWCHPGISSSDALFSFCPQSFPASRTFPVSHLFTSDASASVRPVNIQGRSPLRLTGLISVLSEGLSGVFSSNPARNYQLFVILPSLQSSSHNHMWQLGKTIALTIWTFAGRVMPLLFNTLFRFAIAFLPRSNCLLITWLQSLSTVIL